MNASDFSTSRLFDRLFVQSALSESTPDALQSLPWQGGVGSSWEEAAITQALSDRPPTLTDLTRNLPPSSLKLSGLLAEPAAAVEMDPLGAGANDLSLLTLSRKAAIAPSVPYPGYVLRYVPGLPLENRPAVAQWQAQMQTRGWTISVDGLYGAQSDRIARAFQAEKGLTVDGIVGLQTWQAAFDNSTITGANEPVDNPISEPPTAEPPVVGMPYPGRPLSYSPLQPLLFDPQARRLQSRLQDLDWDIEPDGRFGVRTSAAIRLFQQQNNLEADGIVGPLTWAAVFDVNAPLAPAQQDLNPLATGRINAAGLELIKSFEGLRLNSYRDAVGVWTIGYGHTRTAGPGQRISLSQATELLRSDVATFEKAVSRAVRVPISANQFAALVSFAYNVGSGALNSSTLLRRLNAGDTLGAANEFRRWNRAGGRVLAGLTRRREAERSLFLS